MLMFDTISFFFMTNIPLYNIYICVCVYKVCFECLLSSVLRVGGQKRERSRERKGKKRKREKLKRRRKIWKEGRGRKGREDRWLDFIWSLFVAGNSGHCITMRGSAPCEGPGRMPGAPLVPTLGEKDGQWGARIPGLCKCVHHLDSLSNTAHMTSMTLSWCL